MHIDNLADYKTATRIQLNDVFIIATGPHGFPGASQILCQSLRELQSCGCIATYVGAKEPFLFRTVGSAGVRVVIPPEITGSAIGPERAVATHDVLLICRLSQAIIEEALNIHKVAKGGIWIWGTYLFPYGVAALMAKRALSTMGHKTHLWVTPTGSDVWEIGTQLSALAGSLLADEAITRVLTYTASFASEIQDRFGITREIDSLYPILDQNRFKPVSGSEKMKMRAELGIKQSSFVISSHSNMRPVKRPLDVIAVAQKVAAESKREIVLLMIGPDDLISVPESLNAGAARVIWTGLVGRVESLLTASDIELNCSVHDSFNLSLAESMCCGLPCVSTDIVGIAPEIVSCGGGYLYSLARPSEGMQAAAEYIAALASDEELREAVGRRAADHASRVFSRTRILQQFRLAMLADSDSL